MLKGQKGTSRNSLKRPRKDASKIEGAKKAAVGKHRFSLEP